ncbi:PEP-CTERM sorting domain-containing protein [Coraliomargarita algicola]|uniref:PEP-CTERM sorting domain-containing protein n=1 Tax=Coraliomargarita algicola TaxID=3092156 RepID=A0ABZ0RLC8_9BACT|nr:PEP-CTERM sorting domain-containing protein [Coraliomargarita sp. J2-16]WPJ96226.1 PEP-CTERM sorting domain-containing protein [Coraliomargarita sp. J2-16]
MKKNTPMMKMFSASLFCGLAIPAISSAVTVTPTNVAGTTGDWLQSWNNATTLEGGFAVPDGSLSDVAVINQERVIQVNSVVSTVAGTVVLNNTTDSARPAAFLEVNSGGSLTTGSMIVSQNKDAGDLKVQGGALTTGALDVKDNGTVTVSSGTLTSSSITVDAFRTVATGVFNINGTGFVTSNGAFTNSGTTNVTGGTLAMGSNQISVTGGNFNVNGGAVTVTGGANATNGALKADGGDINLTSGSITVTDDSAGGGTTNVTSTGTLNIAGGNFIVTGQTGASDTVAFNGEVTISSGSFSVAAGQVITNSTAVFNIVGDAATSIEMNNLNLVGSRTATFNFIFDDDGVETVTNAGFMGLSSLTLNVDGSAYAGGIASFDLFTSTNLTSGIEAGNITVTGLGEEGVDWEILQGLGTGGDDKITLNILTVPEPSAYALLGGLLALGHVMVRRRR